MEIHLKQRLHAAQPLIAELRELAISSDTARLKYLKSA
jgi:hypothetical protein